MVFVFGNLIMRILIDQSRNARSNIEHRDSYVYDVFQEGSIGYEVLDFTFCAFEEGVIARGYAVGEAVVGSGEDAVV